MDTTVITALFLFALGVIALVGLLWALSLGFLPATKGFWERAKIKRKEQMILSADRALKVSIDGALPLLRQSFLLEHLRSTDQNIDASVNLHLAILSRLISIAEQRATHLENLAVVEDLTQSRGQLLKAFLEYTAARRGLRSRREEQGKSTPSWAISEFDNKVDDLRDRIETNKKSIETQLDKLFNSLRELSGTTSVTFH